MQNVALLYYTIKKIQRFEDRVIWRVYGRFSRTITRDYAVFFSRAGSPRSLWPGSPRSLWPGSPRSLWPGSPRSLWPGSPRSLWPGSPRSLWPPMAGIGFMVGSYGTNNLYHCCDVIFEGGPYFSTQHDK